MSDVGDDEKMGLDDIDLDLDGEGNESFADAMDVDNEGLDDDTGSMDNNALVNAAQGNDDELLGSGLNFESLHGSNSIAKFSTQAAKRQSRTNAKSVDCLDLEGNVLQVFPSGSSAAQVLGIAQGDISLCCRFLKESVGQYRFRFHGDQTDYKEAAKLRRGYRIVDGSEPVKTEIATRTTRASRGEYAAGSMRQAVDNSLRALLAPAELKVSICPRFDQQRFSYNNVIYFDRLVGRLFLRHVLGI
jgi:hypothetical protein